MTCSAPVGLVDELGDSELAGGLRPTKRINCVGPLSRAHANVRNHFSLERHLTERQTYRERRSAALAEWQVLAS